MTDASTNRSIVIHASDTAADAQRATEVATTLRTSFPDAHIRIVVSGEALTAVPDLSLENVPGGVEIGVCAVGMGRRGIDRASLPEGVEIFPTAPIAIVQAQFEGAAYLRL